MKFNAQDKIAYKIASRAKRRLPEGRDYKSSKKRGGVLSIFSFLALSIALLLPQASFAEEDIVNIYSARKEALILPLLERFEKETGIGFNLVTGKADGLLKRLEIEGDMTPADIFITVDAGRLQRAKDAGVLQAISNEVLEKRIPAHLRDKDKFWFGMSQRARTMIYAKGRVKPEELSTYEDLVDPKWEKRLCVRSSGNIYNQSLVVSLIEANGEEATEKWAKGLVANFAKKPAGGDTDQLKAVAAGACDIALVNTYYFGRMINSNKEKDKQMAEKLAVFWPNQGGQGKEGRGVHVNVSGAGITKHATHIKAAQKLLEFFVTDESQKWYAEVNNEYPVVPSAPISETLKSFGEFKADKLNLTVLGTNNGKAVRLMDRSGWK
ncbi:MAG: Fe(3+) ABC transporter substrate-binding protein [Cocleimonas sp.]|nr:Fe(3+) ABC transporter substrate-binding protein [Cocleimonas sp.]